ncbi:MAG: hypothetical protein JNL90_02130 [Planctomycetes bacterium]|nr:hypothetical protein [Planctomycetota bacterium]
MAASRSAIVRLRRAVVALALVIGHLVVPCAARLDAAQQRSPPEAGAPASAERCIACGGAASGTALVHRGRAVALCSPACAAAWDVNHEQLFAEQQARGALFDESATAAPDERSLFSGWFWFGSYVVVGLLAGAAAAYGALSKGLAPLPWLLAGLAFNVFALLRLWRVPRGDLSQVPGGMPAGLGKIPLTHAPVACPDCGGMNHPNARACVGCGAARVAASSESERALRRSSS